MSGLSCCSWVNADWMYRQERLVAEYLAQANAKRQLVDAASLKMSLEELQNEIAAEKDFLGLS